MKIWGYSERGMINAIFYELAINTNPNGSAMGKLLSLVKRINSDESLFKNECLSDVEIVIEPSLSDHGSPDVLIFFTKKGVRNVVFIEAKVKTWDRVSPWDKNKIVGERVIEQLKCKEKLFNARNQINDKGNIVEYKNIGYNGIVWEVFKNIKAAEKAYYIALLPLKETEKDTYKQALEDESITNLDNWGFLSWNTLSEEQISVGMKNLKFNFNKNSDGENSQIYFIDGKD